MARRSSLHELYLTSVPLGVILNHEKKWSEISVNSSVSQALQTLCREGRSVLPVWNQQLKEYQYCCSRLDIVSMIAWSKGESKGESNGESKGESKDTNNVSSPSWRESPLIDVLETEEHVVDPRIWKFTLTDPLIKLMEPFSKGVHHVLVEDEDFNKKNSNHNDDNHNDDNQNDDDENDNILFDGDAQFYFL